MGMRGPERLGSLYRFGRNEVKKRSERRRIQARAVRQPGCRFGIGKTPRNRRSLFSGRRPRGRLLPEHRVNFPTAEVRLHGNG